MNKRGFLSFLIPVLLLTFTSFLFLYANHCGLGLTYDSHIYLDISKDFVQHGLIHGMHSDWLKAKPPLYPVLVALVDSSRIWLLNLLCFIITCGVYIRLARDFFAQSFYFHVFAACVTLSTSLLTVHSFIWTEPPFITLLGILFLGLYFYLHQQNPRYLWLCGFIGVLLCGLRHAGILVLFSIALSLLICQKHPKHITIFLLTGVLFFLGWALFQSEGFSGRVVTLVNPWRYFHFSRYTYNLTSYANGVSLWFFPQFLPHYLRIFLLLGLLAALGIALKSNFTSIPIFFKIALLSFFFYYLSLHLVFPATYYTAERYLTPFYPIFFLVILYLVSISKFSSAQPLLLRIILITFLLYPTLRSIKNAYFWHELRCHSNTIEHAYQSMNYQVGCKLRVKAASELPINNTSAVAIGSSSPVTELGSSFRCGPAAQT